MHHSYHYVWQDQLLSAFVYGKIWVSGQPIRCPMHQQFDVTVKTASIGRGKECGFVVRTEESQCKNVPPQSGIGASRWRTMDSFRIAGSLAAVQNDVHVHYFTRR